MNILSSTNEKYSLLHRLMIIYDGSNERKIVYKMLLHGLLQLFPSFENHVIANDSGNMLYLENSLLLPWLAHFLMWVQLYMVK